MTMASLVLDPNQSRKEKDKSYHYHVERTTYTICLEFWTLQYTSLNIFNLRNRLECSCIYTRSVLYNIIQAGYISQASMSFPEAHSLNVEVLFSQSINSARLTLVPWSADWIFFFSPSTNSHFCSLTVTRPSLSSSPPRMIANGTSSRSPAPNWAGSLGLFLKR